MSVPSSAELLAVGRARVFFAHQSVGENILTAIPRVYRMRQLPPPKVSELADSGPEDRLVHTRIGHNGDPLGKIAEFDRLIRQGLGDSADAALLKLCYADVRDTTDVRGSFTAYHETMASLQVAYPEVSVLVATVPLTTRRSAKGTVKQWLGRGDRHGPEHNVAREQFNSLLRAAYAGTGRLVDIAAIESTGPRGRRVTNRHRGRTCPALAREYASDHGHLNEAGGVAVAGGMLGVLASAVRA